MDEEIAMAVRLRLSELNDAFQWAGGSPDNGITLVEGAP